MTNLETIEIALKENTPSKSIGTEQEKYIHQFLKYLITTDPNNHEIKINNHIVDVKLDQHIYEIQTANFGKLKNKVASLLDNYQVTIVYPILYEKMLYKVSEDGAISGPRKSPKPDTVYKLFSELYQIQELLENKNLSFKLVLFSVCYYQKERINKYKQIRLSHIDSRINEILDIIDINSCQELDRLVTIPGEFDRHQFEKHAKLSGRNASGALVVLKNLKLITVIRKEGKKYIYKKTK